MMTRIFALLLLGMVSACSMAPAYVRPENPAAADWPEVPVPEGMVRQDNDTPPMDDTGVPQSAPAAVAGEAAAPLQAPTSDISWKQFFVDENLRHLINLALANNRDLRVSALNIERARGMYQIQRADLLPSISATGESANTLVAAELSATRKQETTHQQQVGIGFNSFELDFFGRIQSLKNEALEKYLATEEALKAAQISLVSNVASAYLTLLSDRARLQLASDTLSSQESSYGMIQKRFELGVSSELDLRQAQTSVDTARVDIARYTGQVAMDMTALSLLVGTQVNDSMLPARALAGLVVSEDLPVGLPSQVLFQRPDIVQAEHSLKAANANIGAARANFFPRITLTAFTGTASDELSNLFLSPTGTWSFLPQVSLPIFQGGRNIATLRVSEADKKIAVATYEKAIQTAFQEVSDTLIQKTALAAQCTAQESLTHATSEAYRLSRERYAQGVDSYLTVLDSQRALYASQFNLVTVRSNRELNRIMLYKTLGGGWK